MASSRSRRKGMPARRRVRLVPGFCIMRASRRRKRAILYTGRTSGDLQILSWCREMLVSDWHGKNSILTPIYFATYLIVSGIKLSFLTAVKSLHELDATSLEIDKYKVFYKAQ
jgi:hypothetical protein